MHSLELFGTAGIVYMQNNTWFCEAGSRSGRAEKSVGWWVSCKMEVTRVSEHAYIKIEILRRKSTMKCHSELVEEAGNSANNE